MTWSNGQARGRSGGGVINSQSDLHLKLVDAVHASRICPYDEYGATFT